MNYLDGLYTNTVNGVPQFQPPNPAGVANGTQITYDFLNDVYLEPLNILKTAGIAPAANTPTQVLQSLKRIFGGNRTAVAATTTLTADNAGLIIVNASAGNIVLTLPLANSAGGAPLEFVFMRTDTSTNTVTVQDAGSNTDAPGSATSLVVPTSGPVWLAGDGVSVWDILISGSTGRVLGYQFMTSSGSNTVPAGCTTMDVFLLGGGGAGGGAAAAGSGVFTCGGGGGAGAVRTIRSIPALSATVTIGAAGTPVVGASGGAGGTTSWNGYTAAGGNGGLTGGPSTNFIVNPGAGGGGTLGSESPSGAAGMPGIVLSSQAVGGYGGSSALYGGGGLGSAGSSGQAGQGPGSGGGGSSVSNGSALAGGAGATGCALFIYRT